MISLWVIYLIQVNLVLAGAWLVYRAMLRNTTAFRFNRSYLLLMVLMAVVPLTWLFVGSETFVVEFTLEDIVIYEMNGMQVGANQFSAMDLLWWVYLTGVGVMGARLLIGLVRIIGLISGSKKITVNGTELRHSAKANGTFTFFGTIITSDAIPDADVITHELAHVKGRHSIDVLIMEILAVLFWYNPFIYGLKQSLKEVHEFIADERSSEQTVDRNEYAMRVLSGALNVTPEVITSGFANNTSLRRRIFMLTGHGKQFSNLKGIVVLMLSAIVLTVAVFPGEQNLQQTRSEVYTKAEVMPEFPGGMGEMMNFLGSNIKYPRSSMEANVSGTVYVGFVVDRTGNVEDVHVIKGVEDALDTEALRVVNEMPNWTPGIEAGENVSVKFTLPITFKLQ